MLSMYLKFNFVTYIQITTFTIIIGISWPIFTYVIVHFRSVISFIQVNKLHQETFGIVSIHER